MEKYIVLAIIAIVTVVPTAVWRIYRIRSRMRSVNEVLSKPFACPNCGHRFYAEQKVIRFMTENKAYLKCPKCGKSDLCSRPYDFE